MKKTIMLMLGFVFGLLSNAQNLIPVFPDAIGAGTGTVTWLDYDGDGDQDLLLTGFDPSETNATTLYQNDGTGSFSVVNNTGFYNLAISAIATGDYNKDGAIDLFMMGSTLSNGTQADVYTNNGDGTFTAMEGDFHKVYMGSCNWVDYNNDGFLDIFMTGYDDNASNVVSALYVNDQNGNFTEVPNTGIESVQLSSSIWNDFDGDGWEDVFVSGMGFGTPDIAKIYKNNGDDTFSVMQSFTSVWCSDVAISDYDDDGDMDLIFAGYNTNSASCLTFMMQNNGGVFTQVADNIIGVSHPGIAWGDYNMDGKEDLFITGAHQPADNQMAKLYTHQEDNSFEDSNFFFDGLWWADAAWGDMDNDTDLDLIYIGEAPDGSVHTYVYRNDIINSVEKHFADSPISIYPNPATESISLSVFNTQFDNAKIVNILGETVWNKKELNTNKIDIQKLHPGVYFLQLIQNGEMQSIKFVKNKSNR
jgi:hypothetical protein